MRRAVGFRLLYLVLAISTYVAGFTLLPEHLSTTTDTLLTVTFLAAYFLCLPSIFWLFIINKGGQKRWKIIIPISLACVVSRYSMPAELADYFEFLSWARYPIFAVLLLFEFALFYHVITTLWKARKLQGDPRANALITHINDDKKRDLALLMASEPASWYYAIPRLSRHHIPTLGHLSLLSSQRWHLGVVLLGLLTATVGLYLLLLPVSELVATLVCSLVGYSVVSLTANYRISRHYSIYSHNNYLLVNSGFFNLLFVPLASITHCEIGIWPKPTIKEQLVLGRGKSAVLKLTFSSPAFWFTFMGSFCERHNCVYLCVENPEDVSLALKREITLASANGQPI
jgi:hypothetical protein